MKNVGILIWFLLIIFNINHADANSSRVIEVQEKIKSNISNFLEKFAPGTKYSVQVKVKPLRRKFDYNNKNDNLPFMEFQDDLVIDEWEDPASNVYTLYNRISEAQITIFIEDKVKIEDMKKFKDALLTDVNLVPGRDTVSIEPISTPMLEKTFNWKDQTEILLLGVMLIIAVILGVGLNSLSNKIAPQKVSMSKEGGDNLPSTPAAPSMSMGGMTNNQATSSDFKELKGDLNIQDPSKINEVVGKKIAKLLESEVFPTLHDMVVLEDLLKSDPSSFSYLVYEFPQEVQKNIYQLGRGENWFRGFSEVGFPSKTVLISLDRMLRNRRVNQSEKFEDLLIHVWRINNNYNEFFKALDKNQSFAILFYLPKDISIPVARECFPGSWGSVLEDAPSVKLTNQNEIQSIITDALKFQPYFNYDSLQIFKNRKDLLSYLDKVEPHVEKDIYSVVADRQNLESVRPPFYKYFELNKDQRRMIYEKFTINDWAVACFNVERHEKEIITEILDEKEKYIFSHNLKLMDQNPSLAMNKSDIRKKIAKYIYENLKILSDYQELSTKKQEPVADSDVA